MKHRTPFMQKKHICIIVPAYNEKDNIEELYIRITKVMKKYSTIHL